jgi:phosphoribosyl 1,2-cyclic phosphodiesterase
MLGSGSTGNSLFVQGGNTKILIDAGLSCLQIKKRLKAIGESLQDIRAIIITHEHADHMKGIGVICRQHELPIYMTSATRDQAARYFLFHKSLYSFNGDAFGVGDLQIEAFSVSHDAVDPVGFVISHEGVRVVVATDIGRLDPWVIERLKGAHFIILEANHDSEMLQNGPYPNYLKTRIAGPAGHLANQEAAKAIVHSYTSDLKGIMLAHLSRFNNTPEIAVKTVSEILTSQGLSNIPIYLTHPFQPSPRIEITRWGVKVIIEPKVE